MNAGSNITYAITLSNAGPTNASTVTVTDTVPAGTTFESASVTTGSGWSLTAPSAGGTGEVLFSKGTVAALETAVFEIVVKVSDTAANGTIITNTATAATTTPDPDGGNNTVVASTTVSNTAPTISNILDQTILEDASTGALGFTIGDAETAATSLTLTATSSNQTLVPDANIVFGGSGANRTVTVTPAANQNGGPITITITVSDAASTANDPFTLTVTAGNDPPTISAIADQSAAADTVVGPLAFTVSDIDNTAASLTLSGTSSNQGVVANAGIEFGGSGANRTVTITPVPGQSGQTTITVMVSDGAASVPSAFVLSYAAAPNPPPPPVNQPPALNGVTDLTIEETTTRTLTFTVSDDATPAANLVVTASSSNPTLLPNGSGVSVGGAGGTRTLTLTPVAERVGQATITVTVSDDDALTTTATALVTVTAAPPPLPPTGLVGTALGTGVTLTWVEPTVGATPTFYVIEGGSASGLTTLPVIVTPTRVTQRVLQLPAGVYFFRVRAANRAGTSGPSNEAHVVDIGASPLPGPPTGLAVTVLGPQVSFGWQASAGGGAPENWRLELGSAAGGLDRGTFTIPTAVTSVSGPLPASEYFARVRGINAAGPGEPSNEVHFRVGDVPACDAPQAPVLLPATVTNRLVTLAWRAPGNVAVGAYRLLVGSTPGASDLAVFDVGAVTAFTATAPPGVYYVTVLALNSCGTSTASNAIVVTVAEIDPPSNLTAAVAASQVALSWGAVAGAVSYQLEAGFGPGLSNAGTASVTTTGLVINGVPSGTYYVRVRAVAPSGATSAPSAEIVVVVP